MAYTIQFDHLLFDNLIVYADKLQMVERKKQTANLRSSFPFLLGSGAVYQLAIDQKIVRQAFLAFFHFNC